MMMLFYLIGGLVTLLICGDLLVRGAVALAVKFGVPSLIVGLTVVAFGTSAPELMVSVGAVLNGTPGLAIGNIVGSNVANVLLVLGLPALVYPIACNQPSLPRNTLTMLAVTVLFVIICLGGVLSVLQGLLLFTLLIIFLTYSGYHATRWPEEEHVDDPENIDGVSGLPKSPLAIAGFILIGVVGLPAGAHYFVEGGTEIARFFGVSDAAIGLSVIALGTSAPELATTIMAALRKQPDLAIGNVLGSNIFNLLCIMGITPMIADIPIPHAFIYFDLWVMLIAAMAIVPFAMAGRTITRRAGMFFLAAYVAYMYFLFVADSHNGLA